MIKNIYLAGLILGISVTSGCVSIGPTVEIFTNEPTDDFVVNCSWHNNSIFNFHGGYKLYQSTTNVISSNYFFWCGIGLLGGHGGLSVAHPTYSLPVHINIKQLSKAIEDSKKYNYFLKQIVPSNYSKMIHWKERNKQAKELFDAGYWKHEKDPVGEYLTQIYGCGISNGYLWKYDKDATPDYNYLKKTYFNDITKCNEEAEKIRHAHGRSKAYFYFFIQANKRPSQCKFTNRCGNSQYRPDIYFKWQNERMWGHRAWGDLLTEEEINKNLGKKVTYLVVYERPFSGVWFLLSSYSKELIHKKYPDLTIMYPVVYDDDYKGFHKHYIKSCNGHDLHWDIDDAPTGWLLGYKNGEREIANCYKN